LLLYGIDVNYLAHLYLSPPGEDALLGSLLGDFVKGPLDSAHSRARYGSEVMRAIVLHRRIDSFTDAHPVVRQSRCRISRERRRVAGIMIDIFYDHFLARYWDEFHPRSLAGFSSHFYQILLRRRRELPERLQHIAPSMADRDWLGSYASVDLVDRALNRISRRLRRSNALVGSAEELLRNYDTLERDFRQFIPDVVAFARDQAD
jgi:acyl carrier protein phosphodiesterase